MSTPLSFYNASTGAAVTDMAATMVSQWVRVHTGRPISFQAKWDATGTPVGTFSLQFTNDDVPAYGRAVDASLLTATATDYPAAAFGTTPTQPAGTADNTILMVTAIGDYARLKYTAGSGGTGTTITARLDSSLRTM